MDIRLIDDSDMRVTTDRVRHEERNGGKSVHEDKLAGLSTKTSNTYNYFKKRFLKYINKPTEHVSESDCMNYLKIKEKEGYSGGTLNVMKSSLENLIDRKLDIKYKIRRKIPVILTKQEMLYFINSIENPKHKLIVEMLYSTGMRLGELTNLKWDDLYLDENIAIVRDGKGGKDRYVLIAENIKKRLDENKKKNDVSEYVFSVCGRKLSARAIQHAIKVWANRTGINKNIHVHTFRHTFATHLLENGVDIRKIQVLLGHSNLNTTQIYTAVSKEEIKKIKNPLDQLIS